MKKKLVLKTLVGSACVLRQDQLHRTAGTSRGAVHGKGHCIPRLFVRDIVGDGVGAGNLGIVNGSDDIAPLQARTSCLIADNLTDIEAGGAAIKAGSQLVDIAAGHTQHGTVLHIAIFHQIGDNGLHRIRGDSKSQALIIGGGNLGRVNAHHTAVHVHQGTAGVTGVDGRVRLDAVDSIPRVAVGNRAVQRGDIAKGHAGVELHAAGVAHGHNLIAHLQVGRGGEFRRRQARGVNLNDRQVRLGVLAHQSGFIGHAIAGDHLQIGGSVNHMLVSDDIAILGNDDAGTLACQRRGIGLAVAAPTIAENKTLLADLVVLDADLAAATKTGMFKKVFPERHIDCGIAECNMIGIAAGLSTAGKVPFASSFAMFAAGRAFEQVRNSVGYPHLNVKIGATHAGISVGEDGATHQCNEDIALMRTIPGMVVINPSDDVEARAAVKAAYEYQGPVYLRFGRLAVPVINDRPDYKFEIGKGVTLREGKDVAIIATGLCVNSALEAAEKLAADGIQAKVVNIHTIKPLDEELVVAAAKECGKVVTVEEHSVIGGLGSAVCDVLCEKAPTPVLKIGVQDVFGESGPAVKLLEKYKLDGQGVYEQVKAYM